MRDDLLYHKDAENCWEFWNCPSRTKNKCAAYKLEMGDQCWNVSRDFRPRRKRDFDDCFDCDWFKMRQTFND